MRMCLKFAQPLKFRVSLLVGERQGSGGKIYAFLPDPNPDHMGQVNTRRHRWKILFRSRSYKQFFDLVIDVYVAMKGFSFSSGFTNYLESVSKHI